MRVTMYAVCIYVFIIILSSLLNTILIVDKHCSVMNFRCHKLIAKVNK